jgi:hypothetical protein
MKHLKTYEAGVDKEKYKKFLNRKVRYFSDFLSKSDNITVDAEVDDEETLLKDIHKIIKNFTKLESHFGSDRYRKIGGSFSSFLFDYDNLITKFGYHPKNITEDLINQLSNTEISMCDASHGWFNEGDEYKLYRETVELMDKILHQYKDLEDIADQYNL